MTALDRGRLASVVAHAVAAHAGRHLAWRPKTCWSSLTCVIETLRTSGATGVSCAALQEALRAAEAGAEAITLTLPPVVGSGPAEFAELCRRTHVTTFVDHFAQAEHLARACSAAGTRAELLLRVDVGRQRLGVRPGPDLHGLAIGVSSLGGVRLTGFAVAVTSSNESSGLPILTPSELQRLLQRCCASFRRAGLRPEVVSLSRLEELGNVHEPVATEARTPLIDDPSWTVLLAGVVGRPTRNQAVLDAGRRQLGAAASIVAPLDATVRIVSLEDDFTVLWLDGTGHDLAIGDLIALHPALGIPPWGPQIIVLDGGRCNVERLH